MEHDNSTLYNQIEIHFDLRGEMAATTTNEVSSLSQAHFDEILVLMEIEAFIRSWLLSCRNPCFNGT